MVLQAMHKSIIFSTGILIALLVTSAVGADRVTFTANDGKLPIINGSWIMELKIPYPNKTGDTAEAVFQVQNDDSKSTSAVASDIPVGAVNASTVTVPLSASPSGQKFTLVLEVVKGQKLFYIRDINVSFTYTKGFTNINDSWIGLSETLASNNRAKFQTPLGHVFHCTAKLPLKFSANGPMLLISNTTFHAFDDINWSTAQVETCPRDYPSKPDIRIATGSAFAGLILVAIVTILIMKFCKCGSSDD